MAKFNATSVSFLTILLFALKLNIIGTIPTNEKYNVTPHAKHDYQSVFDNSAHTKTSTVQLNSKYNTDESETSIVVYNKTQNNQQITHVHNTSEQKNDTSPKMNVVKNTVIVPQNNNNKNNNVTNVTANDETDRKLTIARNGEIHLKLNEENNNTSAFEQSVIDTVDVPENETFDLWNKQNLTVNMTTDHHNYYNSSTYVNQEEVKKIWSEIKNITPSMMLSQSHRRAMTVQLSFDFPFYGHLVRNVTVATGGFIYTGDYVHSWLAATQYIAPLMANFDTSLSNESFVRLNDTGFSFTVLWENVYLQDKQDVGKFTFSAKLYKNGDITFTYFSVPIRMSAIHDDKHPVKVGLSDAYIIDKVIHFARRKTIYEYHRVNFADVEIINSTIIHLKALPTCLQYTDCAACVSHDTNFDCTWCPLVNRCSTGTDRKKQEWVNRGCERSQITVVAFCPPIGARGNNATLNDGNNHVTHINSPSSISSNNTFKSGGNYKQSTTGTSTSTMASIETVHSKSMSEKTQSIVDHSTDTKSVSLTLGVFVPIIPIVCVILWVLYAYRNPHTKSGQLLIQYRPSQWSWRRGEARYTAATIHM